MTYMLHGHIHKSEDQVLVDRFCTETRATRRKTAHQEEVQPVPCQMINCFCIQFIQVLLEANGLAAGKDHQFKGRYDAEKNAVIISLEKDEQSAISPQKCTT